MFQGTVFCVPRSDAIRHAATYLAQQNITVTDKPEPDVTHLLLPVPSFQKGDEYLAHLLAELPDEMIICGGNLQSPLVENYRTVDFLQDPYYLADNAAITASCAVAILSKRTQISGCSVLILGWGRIGKCLGFALRDQQANVTIAARKPADLALIHALGFSPLPMEALNSNLMQYDIIVNTVPVILLPRMECRPDCIALELASKPGMVGSHIITARGLPGQMAPAASGKLIADTFIRLFAS